MTTSSDVSERGPLFPAELPVDFTRIPAGPKGSDLVTWWWFSTWAIPPGQHSAQELLAFPASNLAFESDGVRYWGPTTRRSTRDLVGAGWVLGALLRPAAVPAFTQRPAAHRDESVPVSAAEVHAAVQASVEDLAGVVDEVEAWLSERVGKIDDEARQANRLADLAITDSSITTVSDLAAELGVSTRTVNRLTTKYVGLSPYAMIRRRRLQEAVQWTREHPDDALSDIAIRFGFVDQAHLSREARTFLGLTLTNYRLRTTQE